VFGRRMLYFPHHPILSQGSLIVGAIHGGVRDFQSTLGAPQQGKGSFHWAAHQILGVTSKKMRSESSFGACNAHTCRYRARIGTGGIYNSLVDPWPTLNGQFSIENKGPIRIVLGLQMALEGSRCKARAANIALHPTMLRGGVNRS
jgi:hypothetical protein